MCTIAHVKATKSENFLLKSNNYLLKRYICKFVHDRKIHELKKTENVYAYTLCYN